MQSLIKEIRRIPLCVRWQDDDDYTGEEIVTYYNFFSWQESRRDIIDLNAALRFELARDNNSNVFTLFDNNIDNLQTLLFLVYHKQLELVNHIPAHTIIETTKLFERSEVAVLFFCYHGLLQQLKLIFSEDVFRHCYHYIFDTIALTNIPSLIRLSEDMVMK